MYTECDATQLIDDTMRDIRERSKMKWNKTAVILNAFENRLRAGLV